MNRVSAPRKIGPMTTLTIMFPIRQFETEGQSASGDSRPPLGRIHPIQKELSQMGIAASNAEEKAGSLALCISPQGTKKRVWEGGQ